MYTLIKTIPVKSPCKEHVKEMLGDIVQKQDQNWKGRELENGNTEFKCTRCSEARIYQPKKNKTLL
jgi:hypothetical protein